MGNCTSQRDQGVKEKRGYHDMVVEVVSVDDRVLKNAQCIINIDSDPPNSRLMQIIRQLKVDLKEQDSFKEQESQQSEILDQPIECILGTWLIQEFRPRILESTKYIAHLQIDNTLTKETLHKLYQDLFIQLSNKVIQSVYFPQHWVRYSSVSITENAEALFEQMFDWRNQDQKSLVNFTVYADLDNATLIADEFLAIYNAFNPLTQPSPIQKEESYNAEPDQPKIKN